MNASSKYERKSSYSTAENMAFSDDNNDSYISKPEESEPMNYDPDSKILRIYYGGFYNKESNL